jgi:glutamate/tyrosine decarboxylase-like PLP-dependent enzyme
MSARAERIAGEAEGISAGDYRHAFADLLGIDGAIAPGDDALLPAAPRVIAREVLWQLAAVTEQLWEHFDRAVRGAIEQHGRLTLARQLGFPEPSAELIAAFASSVPAPVRADFVPSPEGYRLVEWNVDPCLGGLAGQRLFECFLRAGSAADTVFLDPAALLGASLARLRSRGRPLIVALRRVDRARWGGNAERIAEVARQRGLQAGVASLDEIIRMSATQAVDVLRLFHLEHTQGPDGEMRELLERARAERVHFVYGFDTELWGDKQWLARLDLPASLRPFVPHTHAASDIAGALLKTPADWVLKPHAGAAGQDVILGAKANPQEWAAALERALGEPGWVAQRLVEPTQRTSEYVDVPSGLHVHRREVETLGIFLVEGRFAGAYSRTRAAEDGWVIDAASSFNVVVTTRPGSLPLDPELRRMWDHARPSALRARLRTFETLAFGHLVSGGGSRTTAAPSEAISGFPRMPLPEQGEPLEAIIQALRQDLLPFCHDKRRSEYLAHLDVPPADLSIASGTLIRALAQDPVTWTSSRAGTFVEEQVLGWLCNLAYRRRPAAGAVACSGGTQANFLAVLLARNLALGDNVVARRGLAAALRDSGVRGLKVLASQAAHGSIAAAVRNAGLGDEGLVRLPVDAHDRVRLDALDEALTLAERDGDRVALVVLNAGTVGIGAIDPLHEAIALARRHRARVHVDAAHGAMLLWSRQHALRLDGLDSADSVTADPHKILGLNQGLGALLLRRADDRQAVTKDGAPYFQACEGAPQSSRFTLDGTRPLNALGAWILLKHLGRSGYAAIVDHLMHLAERFTDGVCQTGELELYAPPAMNLLAFRPLDGLRDVATLEAELGATPYRLSRYQSSRGAFLRAVFVNPATTIDTVDELLSCLRRSLAKSAA